MSRAEEAPGDRRLWMVVAGLILAIVIGSGLMVPHWPAPWGRDAGAIEQLIIDEELKAKLTGH